MSITYTTSDYINQLHKVRDDMNTSLSVVNLGVGENATMNDMRTQLDKCVELINCLLTNSGDSVANLVNNEITSLRVNACRSLTSVVTASFPNVTVVNSNAFYNCSSLEKIELVSATSIIAGAFQNCTSLATVVLGNSFCSLGNVSAFANTPIANGTGYIYVPESLIVTYQSATNWSTYAEKFRAIEDYEVEV